MQVLTFRSTWHHVTNPTAVKLAPGVLAQDPSGGTAGHPKHFSVHSPPGKNTDPVIYKHQSSQETIANTGPIVVNTGELLSLVQGYYYSQMHHCNAHRDVLHIQAPDSHAAFHKHGLASAQRARTTFQTAILLLPRATQFEPSNPRRRQEQAA